MYRSPEEILDAGGKTGQEHVANLFEIKKAINYNEDAVLKSTVLSNFFAVDVNDFEHGSAEGEWKGRPRKFSRRDIALPTSTIPSQEFEDDSGAEFEYENDYEFDLKNFLGEEKYNLFKTYQQKGTLEIDEIPDNLKDAFNED